MSDPTRLVRHPKGGLTITCEAASANAKLDREIRQGLRCEACGRKFNEKVPRSEVDKNFCTQCQESIDL